jgi:5-methylcytosine-specific restriction endonuclease McrA
MAGKGKRKSRLFNYQQGFCFYCAKRMRLRIRKKEGLHEAGDLATLDHFIPRIRGGLNMQGNKVLACIECNTRKNNMTAFEFMVHMIGTSPL